MPYTKPEPGDEVVIAGIAGRYPSCATVQDLHEKIMNKEDLITETTRWNPEYEEIPSRAGEVPTPEKFDAVFFGVHSKQVATMDPMSRSLMEHSYEAIIDAGLNPAEIRGKKVAVVIGLCYSESERVMLYDRGNQAGGFVVTGCSRAMIPNRISYWLGVHGPSYTVDTACSSSAYALEHCYRLIMSGECDGAIVGGSNLCLHPYITLHFARLGVLAPDGRCKTFDADADGYVRSDAVCAVYLQRAKDAKRVYATVVHCKTNSDGYKKDGITFPSSRLQERLLHDFYEECKISPTVLNYLEAHGTGTKVGDPQEILAVDGVFTKGRKTPLKIGSIKSNLGHSEPVSCLCGISKVIIAMESGIIPPNINYKKPRDEIRAIVEGRLEVVTEKTPWEGGYAAVNTFGFGGSNAHVLMKSNTKEKINGGRPADDLPRLVAVSGRTEKAVHALLDSVDKNGIDVEYVRLLHDVHNYNIPKHGYRGYAVVGSERKGLQLREIVPYGDEVRPIWFVFSGMGSQWPEMGKKLMRFPVFAKAIAKCDAVLRPRGLDIVHIITTSDKTIVDNILNCFVGIAAIQIGLVDLLTAIGIVPDNIIGHSVGELGCAYSDGCFTAEQMILAAYARGLASIETEMIHGAMAAIGMSASQIQPMCPKDIDVACHNSKNSCTISGPSASIKAFVAQLVEMKIFAKEVASGEIAYHSRYIAKAGPKLLAYLSKIIPEPKERSKKWLSTSVPQEDWSTDAAKYSSAEYHTNNLLSSVLFEETAAHIPSNAICIEIAPHGLLQAILKRSLPSTVVNIPLTLRGHHDNAEFFAVAIGKLYNIGQQPKIAELYPPVSFPVSRGTPMISPNIKWDHTEDYYVAYFDDKEKIASGERSIEVSVGDQAFEYLKGHVIDGRNLLPATGYLWLVWDTVALIRRCSYKTISIVFEDVRFERATTLQHDGSIMTLSIMIHKGSGRFEILENDSALVSGKMRITTQPAAEKIGSEYLTPPPGDEVLDTDDIYKELKIRGYDYTGVFRSMKSATIDGRKGHINWADNYVGFMDTMMQMKVFGTQKRALYVPTSIRKLVIDPHMHEGIANSMDPDNKAFPAYVSKEMDVIVAGGIQIFGVIAKSIPRRKVAGIPVLEEYKFVGHRDRAQVSIEEMIVLSSHIALDIQPTANLKTLEILDHGDGVTEDNLLSPVLERVLKDLPMVQPVVNVAASEEEYGDAAVASEIHFVDPLKLPVDGSMFMVVGRNLLTKDMARMKSILAAIREGGFILTVEAVINKNTFQRAAEARLDIIIEKCSGNTTLLLLKRHLTDAESTEVVHVSSKGLDWVEKVKEALMKASKVEKPARLLLVSQADRECGILGMVNCLKKEPGGELVRAVIIHDANAPRFALNNPLYSQQLQLDLPINILQGGVWGSYRHLPLPPAKPKLCYHAFVDQMVRGDLSSFRWLEGPFTAKSRPNDQIRSVYLALNFKDIMLATGRITEEFVAQRKNTTSTESFIGFEFSGINAAGQGVMGFLSVVGLSNIYYPEVALLWNIPPHWSFEDAATTPAAYITALYSLYIADDIKKGDKVLIHSGSGGVGQAAIHLALTEGCEVFTTVGTPEKRRFIHERFPSIPDDHIGNSRDTSFEHMVMRMTNGDGVNVVLNSLSEDKLLASVRCLSRYGRFLEIGKYDIAANNPLNMLVFLNELTFRSVMLDFSMVDETGRPDKLHVLLQKFLDAERIVPINRKVFDKEDVEAAVRYMAAGKHIGKVLIKMCDENGPFDKPILAYPRYYCSTEASYVIFGGLGGLGLEVADWLCSRNAKKLVLVSRRGITTGYQKMKIHYWRADGRTVEVIQGKYAWKREDCEYVLKAAAKLGPVDAVFNLAVQLKDALIENQTVESYEESMKPKVGITKQLDELTRTLCPRLRHFVVFSSASCGRGTPGQTNYGYGNSVMERICERRVAEGLPGLAIQWGAVGEVGLVADMDKENKGLSIGGTLQQKVASCMREMERFLLQSHPVVSSMVVAEKSRGVGAAENPLQAVLSIMGVKNVETVNKDTPLIELGMDSMLAVEIKETLERDFDVFLTVTEMRTLNYRKLMALSGDKKAISAESESSKAKNEAAPEGIFWGTAQIIKDLNTIVENITTCVDFPVAADKSGIRVFMVPGIEGNFSTFNTILGHMKHSVTCLQFPYSNEHKTVHDIVDYLLPYVKPKLAGIKEAVVVGYSFGGLVAIELAKKMEKLGQKLRLIIIDGAPVAIKNLAVSGAQSNSESHIHSRVLLTLGTKVLPSALPQITGRLETLESLDEKLELVVAHSGIAHVPLSYQKAVAGAICTRTYAAYIYDVDATPPLKAPVTLLKASRGLTLLPDGLHELDKVTKGKITETTIDGDHISIRENTVIADVINESTAT